MELLNPEEVWREFANFAFGVGGGEFLLVIEECSGKTALGVVVHFLGADLELNNLAIWRDDCGVERLIAVGLWHRDVILYAAIQRAV